MKRSLLFALLLSASAGAQVDPALAPTEEIAEDGRIVGGDPAERGTAPWQIQIYSTVEYTPQDFADDLKLPDGDPAKLYLDKRDGYELTHRCGGSYIGGGWIVTAAHCLKVPKGGNFLTDRRVKMGTQNLKSGGATFAIDTAVGHVAYTKGRNDIALIKVRDEGQIAGLIADGRLAAVPLHATTDPLLYRNEELRVTGWGYMGKMTTESFQRMDSGNRVQNNPVELYQVAVNFREDSVCAKEPHYKKLWHAQSLCAGSANPGRDSCVGDSGGPLTRLQKGKRVLVGIVAFGIGCAYKGIPGVYMRVSAYQDWIARARLAPEGYSQK